MRNRVGLIVSAVSLALLTPPAFAHFQDRVDSKVGGSVMARKGTWTGYIAENSCFRTKVGASAALADHANCTLECAKKGGPSNWLGLLTDEEGFMRIVGKHAENNYAPLYQYVGKKIEVTGLVTERNQYSLGLPRELTIEKISVK